jgi:Ras homolog gene family, member A
MSSIDRTMVVIGDSGVGKFMCNFFMASIYQISILSTSREDLSSHTDWFSPLPVCGGLLEVVRACVELRQSNQQLHSQVVNGGYLKRMTVDGKHINMALWDPAGVFHAEMTNSGRQQLYPDSAIVVICFSIDNPDSFRSVTERWYPEVRHFCSAPILLVGCKADLRDPQRSSYEDDNVAEVTTKWVTNEQGRLIAGNIQAVEYLECSAVRNQGVDQVMLSAARIATSWNPNGQSSGRSTCQII